MITTSVGEQKRKCDIPINDQQWKSSVSFFINNNSTNDMVCVYVCVCVCVCVVVVCV